MFEFTTNLLGEYTPMPLAKFFILLLMTGVVLGWAWENIIKPWSKKK